MRQWPLTAGVLLAAGVVSAAEPAPTGEFWDWFDTYADKQGQVFDPIALVETQLHLEQTLIVTEAEAKSEQSNEVNSDESMVDDTASAVE